MHSVTSNAVANAMSYKTNEIFTGAYWENKPIYRKIIPCGNMPNNTTKYINPDISNIDAVVGITPLMYTNDTTVISGNWAISNVYLRTSYNVNSGLLSIITGFDGSNYTMLVVLEYTKTTD